MNRMTVNRATAALVRRRTGRSSLSNVDFEGALGLLATEAVFDFLTAVAGL